MAFQFALRKEILSFLVANTLLNAVSVGRFVMLLVGHKSPFCAFSVGDVNYNFCANAWLTYFITATAALPTKTRLQWPKLAMSTALFLLK